MHAVVAAIAQVYLRLFSLALTPLVVIIHAFTYVYTCLFSSSKPPLPDKGVVTHAVHEDVSDGSKTELLIVGKPTNTLFLMIPGEL